MSDRLMPMPVTSLARMPRLSGLPSIPLRRGAITQLAARYDDHRLRGWLDDHLRRARAGDQDARLTLVAWVSALLPRRDVELSLRLRSLDQDLTDDEELAPLTVAFIRVTAAPSAGRRLPEGARLGGDEHAESAMLRGWHIYDERQERVWARRSAEAVVGPSGERLRGEPWRPWLDGLSPDEIAALDDDERETLWETWACRPDRELFDVDLRIPVRRGIGTHYPFRPAREPALKHPSLRLRRKLLTEPALTEREVLWMAAQRPTRAGLLLAIADDDRWFFRPRVRNALAYNPYTPSWLVGALLPLSPPKVVGELAQHHDAPSVQALARLLRAS